ncbi:TPA: hypothetical protein ACGPDY_003196 [Klebsiella variicola]
MSLNITESYKVAVISTAHVTQADSEILPQISFDPITDRGHNWIHGTEYGWIVRAGLHAEAWKESLREAGSAGRRSRTSRKSWALVLRSCILTATQIRLTACKFGIGNYA